MLFFFFSKLYIKHFDYYKKWKYNGSRLAGVKYKIARKLCLSYFRKKFPKYAAKHPVYGLNQKYERKAKIIVSLTSFPGRIDKVWITVATIMRQSVKPDAIELWLSEKQFPFGKDDLPDNLLNLQKYGLSIRFCEDNLRSHKKYYYVMQSHPNDIVITCDDDVIYSKNTIEQLITVYKRDNFSVVGMCTVRYDKNDFLTPIKWQANPFCIIGNNNICVVGCGATLFPPHALSEKAFNKELIKKTCPYADDLWLTAMTYLNGKTISSVGRLPFPFSVEGTQDEALTKTNNSESSAINNDTQWNAVLNEFSDELKEWKEKIMNE